MNPDLAPWIGLTLVPGIGPVTAKKLIASFGGPEGVFGARIGDLLAVRGVTREQARNIRDFRAWDEVGRHCRAVEEKGIAGITFSGQDYPAILREVADAPVLLFTRGAYLPDDRFSIAVVGSRKYSPYGESVTMRISCELAAAGFTVVSGMARGIDTLAHKSALAAGGRTIGVLGSGLDICYPSENRGLMERTTRSGCLISEFLPGTLPNPENFPRRNRLISGLSLGVLVVEAAAKSGALITAGYALEQNRSVFAVPGNITSPASEGTNGLIRQGAIMVLRTEDIMEDLLPALKGFLRKDRHEQVPRSREEDEVCRSMSGEAKHVDLLARETGLPVNVLLDRLLVLEMKGLVRQASGKRFYLA